MPWALGGKVSRAAGEASLGEAAVLGHHRGRGGWRLRPRRDSFPPEMQGARKGNVGDGVGRDTFASEATSEGNTWFAQGFLLIFGWLFHVPS